MKSHEELVASESDYFIYSPSKLALETFLYPMQCGIFSYLPGYAITRESFDSFLLMYIQKGELDIVFDNQTIHVKEGHFVLLDCYKRHSYSTTTGWECLWCHFDGLMARAYYNNVISRLGNVFTLTDTYPVLRTLTSILKVFYNGSTVREALMNKYLTDIMTEFLLYASSDQNQNSRNYTNIAEEAITYINEHFKEDIPIETLASRAHLSQYHFIRTFKKETGFTPHEYIINIRMATAKYLLKSTKLTIKDICFAAGFSCESAFCFAFRKQFNMTPKQYRILEESAPPV